MSRDEFGWWDRETRETRAEFIERELARMRSAPNPDAELEARQVEHMRQSLNDNRELFMQGETKTLAVRLGEYSIDRRIRWEDEPLVDLPRGRDDRDADSR